MQYLRQSTAATVLVGPVLDADGAAVTGAVIGDFRLAKNGTVTTMSGNTINHSHNGCYLIGLTTTDTNTLDRLSISVGNTSYAMTVFRYTVLSANQFDALVTNGTITTDAIADQVWDEILTGATHNIPTSAGRRLRQLASVIVHSGTAQGAGTGNNQIQLDTGASSTNGAYDPGLIYIETGTGAGQTRLILQYNGSTRTATVDRDWRTNPDNTSEFVILGDAGRESVNEGLAQGGTSTTITLNANASSDDDAYNGQLVFIRSGTGQDQVALVTDYVGSTKVATIKTRSATGQWAVTPDTTSAYVMMPNLTWTLEEIGEAASGGSITVAPLQATAPNRVAGTEIVTYINDTSPIGPIVVTDGDGDAVDLSSYTLRVCVELKSTGTINANITPTVSGAGNNQITFTPTSDCVSSTLPRKWSLRSTSDGQVFAFGDFTVEATARLS